MKNILNQMVCEEIAETIQKFVWKVQIDFFTKSCLLKIVKKVLKELFQQHEPTTFDHINMKYIWGPMSNHIGTPR